MNLCKWFGHKWKPVYICGIYGDTHLKFIGAYCRRCFLGYNELIETAKKQSYSVYNTYSEKYFFRDTE